MYGPARELLLFPEEVSGSEFRRCVLRSVLAILLLVTGFRFGFLVRRLVDPVDAQRACV
jgi:hypothetical protein